MTQQDEDREDFDPLVPDAERVLTIWAGLFRLTREDITGRRRLPRHVACRAAIAHELHGSGWYGVEEIADLLQRDHSSVCNLLKTYGPGGRRLERPGRAPLRVVGGAAGHTTKGARKATGGA